MSSFGSAFHGLVRRLGEFAPLLIALYVQFVLLRGFEITIVTQRHALPEGTGSFFWKGVLFDAATAALFGGLLFVVFLVLRPVGPRVAFYGSLGVGTLVLLGTAALIQYFGITLVPLGVDLFAYSPGDMLDTVQTSVDLTPTTVAPYLLVLIGFTGMTYALARLPVFSGAHPSSAVGAVVGLWMVLGLVLHVSARPAPDAFDRPAHRHVFENKLLFFVDAVWDRARTRSVGAYEGEEYPLLRPARDRNVLAPYLQSAERPPNVVFIMVEGLSSIFVGPDARWGGFTPFLDSLRQKSLYWPNALSTSGRSFNVVPSLFGSLPYGDRGFLDLGFRMPAHHSLIQILKENGYHTAFYSGYSAAFDNVNLFLERQGIDRIVDRDDFDARFEPMDEDQQGFTWGYADKDLMRQSMSLIGTEPTDRPRLDIVFTVNFHEPFVIPEQGQYLQRVRERIERMDISEERKASYRTYEDIFAALLYTDDAIRLFLDAYRQRPDYEETLFVITGDHRIAPIPHATELSRFRVPLLLYSPRIQTPRSFPPVVSHLQVTPTLLAHLTAQHGLTQPDSVHWMAGVLDTSSTFRSDVELPLMRNKNQLIDYVDGDRVLAGDQAYTIREGFALESAGTQVAQELKTELQAFKRMNQYVVQQDKLIPSPGRRPVDQATVQQEDSLLAALGAEGESVVSLFERARTRAFNQEYEVARILLRRVLRRAPDYHDARLLYGRTYGWSGSYEPAEQAFREVLRRDSTTIGAYVALADLNYWRGDPEQTIEWAEQGMSHHPSSARLRYRLARAHVQNGDDATARTLLQEILDDRPDYEDAQSLLSKLQN